VVKVTAAHAPRRTGGVRDSGRMPTDLDAAANRLFAEFLGRMHLSHPDALAEVAAEVAEDALGTSELVLHLANYEQTMLVPVPSTHAGDRPALAIDGTLAGHAFTSSTIHEAATDDAGRRRLWVPVLDGTERLGVLELCVRAPGGEVTTELMAVVERYAHAIAQAVVSKGQYGDVFEHVRRSQPMTLGSELLHTVLPPSVFATDGLVISTMLEPAYDNGGDAFDYCVNADRAHLAVFDGMGHGLDAAGISTFAVAAYRHSRRIGQGLAETYDAMDAAVVRQFEGSRFVTAVLVELDLVHGVLHWVSAGHPPPLLIRHGRVVKRLDVEPATPLGLPSATSTVAVGEEHLEAGDSLLLYTDGLTEARRPGGGLLDEKGLADFVQRQAAALLASPETLRRLRLAILAHQGGVLHDDATALLVDWRRDVEQLLLPQTV
jgi:serine phosphatase RsbU (regulator of sigma subunit)